MQEKFNNLQWRQKMKKIEYTVEQMSAIYKMAKAIYNKEERLKNGKEILFLSHGINKNSFADFYRALNNMLEGKLHTRGINTDLRDYYLSQIYKDYGGERLKIALKAYMDFILYYEGGHNNTTRKIERDIHQKYCNILSESYANRTIENGINTYWEGELGQVTITAHERNIHARNKCIQSKGTKCVVCGFDFEKNLWRVRKRFHTYTPCNPNF